MIVLVDLEREERIWQKDFLHPLIWCFYEEKRGWFVKIPTTSRPTILTLLSAEDWVDLVRKYVNFKWNKLQYPFYHFNTFMNWDKNDITVEWQEFCFPHFLSLLNQTKHNHFPFIYLLNIQTREEIIFILLLPLIFSSLSFPFQTPNHSVSSRTCLSYRLIKK